MTAMSPSSSPSHPPQILPGNFTPRFVRFFTWYAKRLFAKKFHALRTAPGTHAALREAGAHNGPLIVLLNHSAWWDPLVPLLLAECWRRDGLAERSACAPMDIEQLRKFGFFRRLGLFGVDPSDTRSFPAMCEYVLARFGSETRPTLWITPQGTFADVREPVRMRPGAAAIAARAKNVRVLSVTLEYAFWLDQRPEIFVRAAGVPAPASPSTPHWHSAMESAMNANAGELSRLVIARDANAFTPLLDGASSANIHPVYDWWLRIRGKDAALRDRQREQTHREATA